MMVLNVAYQKLLITTAKEKKRSKNNPTETNKNEELSNFLSVYIYSWR